MKWFWGILIAAFIIATIIQPLILLYVFAIMILIMYIVEDRTFFTGRKRHPEVQKVKVVK